MSDTYRKNPAVRGNSGFHRPHLRAARRAVNQALVVGNWDEVDTTYTVHTRRGDPWVCWFGTRWRHHSCTDSPHQIPRVTVRTRSGGLKDMVCLRATDDTYRTAQGVDSYGRRKKTKAPLKTKNPSLLGIEAGAKRDRARKNKTHSESKARHEEEAAQLRLLENGVRLLRREHQFSFLSTPPFNAMYLTVKSEINTGWWNLSDKEIALSIHKGEFEELHTRITAPNEDGERVDAYFAYKLWSRLWRYWGSWFCLKGHNNAGDRSITCHKCGGL